MREQITKRLAEIAEQHGIEHVLAVESGSRLWGFESEDSDWDVRFVYKRPLSWYVSCWPRRDVIEPKDPFPLDFSGWDLQKALGLLAKSNPPLLEWLQSEQHYLWSELAQQMASLAARYFNPSGCIYHYLHMANGNYRTYLQGDLVRTKKYLYVIRPLLACAWIEEHKTFPPPQWDALADGLGAKPSKVRPMLLFNDLLDRKRSGQEMEKGERIDELNTWIERELVRFGEIARTAPRNKLDGDELNEFLFYAVR